MADVPMSSEQKLAILPALAAYERARGATSEALQRLFDECRTVVDTHPTTLDFHVKSGGLMEASDALVAAMMDAGVPILRVRGGARDVLYLIVPEGMLIEERESAAGLVIRRIDLGEGSKDAPWVIDMGP